MKKTIIYSLLIFLNIHSLVAQESLTFEHAQQRMESRNLSLKSAQSNKKAQEMQRKTMRGLYLPKVSISATYMKLDQDVGLDISPISEAYGNFTGAPANKQLPSTLVLQNEDFTVAGVNFIWPIFTGGKIRSANKAMDANIDDALYKIEQKENELNTELVERYYGYRLSTKAVELYKEAYDAMLIHLDHAQKLEENGMISKAQRLYVEFTTSNAKMEWQKAIKQNNTVKEALNNTLGDSTDIIPISELFLLKNIEPVDFFQQSAIENNPLLKQVNSKKQLAKANYNIKRSDYLPTLALVGNKELYTQDLSHLMPDWFVGVNLSWTVFDGVSRTYKVKSARATMDMVDYIDAKAKSDITTYINKLYNDLQMQVEQLETMEKTYEFANEYLRVQKKAFAEGFATTKEVTDAELTVNKVKIGRAKTMNDYVLSLAKLLEFSGQTNLFLQYSIRADREKEDFPEINE